MRRAACRLIWTIDPYGRGAALGSLCPCGGGGGGGVGVVEAAASGLGGLAFEGGGGGGVELRRSGGGGGVFLSLLASFRFASSDDDSSESSAPSALRSNCLCLCRLSVLSPAGIKLESDSHPSLGLGRRFLRALSFSVALSSASLEASISTAPAAPDTGGWSSSEQEL